MKGWGVVLIGGTAAGLLGYFTRNGVGLGGWSIAGLGLAGLAMAGILTAIGGS